jgi:hypothetical protein
VLKPKDRCSGPIILWSTRGPKQLRKIPKLSYWLGAYAATGKHQRGYALHAACRHAVFAMRGTPPSFVGEQSVIVACFEPIPLIISILCRVFRDCSPKQSPNAACMYYSIRQATTPSSLASMINLTLRNGGQERTGIMITS